MAKKILHWDKSCAFRREGKASKEYAGGRKKPLKDKSNFLKRNLI